MELLLLGIVAIFIYRLFVFGNIEITPLKYCILKAMANQSKDVANELEKLLSKKSDYKIINKEFKSLEKLFVGNLNTYLFEIRDSDVHEFRKKILETTQLEL